MSAIINQNIESNSSLYLQIHTLGFNQEFIFCYKQSRIIGTSKWTLSKNISLEIIAEYLWRTFDSTRKRLVFIINDIIEK